MSRLSAIAGGATAGVIGAALGACTAWSPVPTPEPALQRPAALDRWLAQVGFGSAAQFVSCAMPACPRPTPKAFDAPTEPILREPAARTAALPTNQLPPTDAAESRAGPSGPGTASVAEPTRLVLQFANGSALLTHAHKDALRSALPGLRLSKRIVIAGRTDDLGAAALNEQLALARGLAVRDELLTLAPDLPAPIAIDARGRCCYAAANDGPLARAKNRRVEVQSLPTAKAAP